MVTPKHKKLCLEGHEIYRFLVIIILFVVCLIYAEENILIQIMHFHNITNIATL